MLLIKTSFYLFVYWKHCIANNLWTWYYLIIIHLFLIICHLLLNIIIVRRSTPALSRSPLFFLSCSLRGITCRNDWLVYVIPWVLQLSAVFIGLIIILLKRLCLFRDSLHHIGWMTIIVILAYFFSRRFHLRLVFVANRILICFNFNILVLIFDYHRL